MTTNDTTFISLLAQGYEFRAWRHDESDGEDEIWLNLSSPLSGTLERCSLDATTEELHAHLEVLAANFIVHEEACKADPNCCTLDEMLAHQRAKA